MAQDWLLMLQNKAPPWNIPAPAVQGLADKTAAAENCLAHSLSPERTKIATARTKTAFHDLAVCMRDFKCRYYLLPPLENADLVSLGLKPRGRALSPEETPTAQPEADLVFPGIHLVELRNICPAGGARPGDGSEFGVRVYYGLTGTPTWRHKFRVEGVPAGGYDLPSSVWASRKKLRFDFDGESGNTVYFCLRYENKQGKAGPFGPILKAFIP
jgi:hypothetical protein